MELLLVVPCSFVIDDRNSGHSLIGIFHELKILLPPDADIPSNAMVPKEWAVFWKFALDPEEEGKDYSLVANFFWPDGTIFAQQTLVATPPTRNGMAFVVRLQSFPLGQSGKIKVVSTLNSGEKIVLGPINLELTLSVEKSLSGSPVSA